MPDAIQPNHLIPNALNGFRNALKVAVQAGESLSRGEVSTDSVIKMKLASQNVRVQTVNLKTALEVEQHIIDLLA